KSFFLISILFFFTSSIQAQELKKQIDSLITLPYDVIYSEPKEFISLFQDWIETSKEIDYKFGTAKLYSKLSLMYSSVSESDSSQEARIKAIKLFEELNSEIELISEYGLYGYHLLRTNLDLAKHYIRLAIKLGEKNNAKKALCSIYGHYSTSLQISNDLDSALYYSKKGLDIKYEIADTIGIPYSLNGLAGIYAILGNMDKAFEYMAESDKYRLKETSNYGRAENAVISGELYAQIEKYDIAIIKFNESLNLAKIMGNKHMAQYNYEKLSDIYQKKGDYKTAYKKLKDHKLYHDSILNSETNEKIAELEIKFETEKKDRQIAEQGLSISKRNNQLYIAIGTIFILILLAFGIYKTQKLLQEKIRKELELKNKLKQIEADKKITDEKLRISRELHDNIGSQITFLISSLDNLTFSKNTNQIHLEKNVVNKLESLSNFGRTTLADLRNSIWALKSDGSNTKILVTKLNELKLSFLNNVENIQVQMENNISKDIILTSSQNLNLYRIVQECFQNIIKHSNASKIKISLDDTQKGFSLKFIDNGQGFDITKINNGNGIENMKQRCNEISGLLNLESSSTMTTITCELDLSNKS
ncbi:MAG: ATP-binding protein, partial [Melioribacteraceae bacterium]